MPFSVARGSAAHERRRRRVDRAPRRDVPRSRSRTRRNAARRVDRGRRPDPGRPDRCFVAARGTRRDSSSRVAERRPEDPETRLPDRETNEWVFAHPPAVARPDVVAVLPVGHRGRRRRVGVGARGRAPRAAHGRDVRRVRAREGKRTRKREETRARVLRAHRRGGVVPVPRRARRLRGRVRRGSARSVRESFFSPGPGTHSPLRGVSGRALSEPATSGRRGDAREPHAARASRDLEVLGRGPASRSRRRRASRPVATARTRPRTRRRRGERRFSRRRPPERGDARVFVAQAPRDVRGRRGPGRVPGVAPDPGNRRRRRRRKKNGRRNAEAGAARRGGGGRRGGRRVAVSADGRRAGRGGRQGDAALGFRRGGLPSGRSGRRRR